MTHPRLASLLAVAAVAGCGDNMTNDDPPDAATAPGPDAADPIPDADPTPQPGLRVLDYMIAVDVTPDGQTAVFEDLSTGDIHLIFVDTVTGEAVDHGSVGDPSRNLATGVSATGRISALHGEPVQAGVWDAAGGWLDLGSPHPAGCGDAEISGAFDISAAGDVVVGLAWNGCNPDAFRWSDASGTGVFTTLAVLGTQFEGSSGPPTNRATVVSDDGQVYAGFAQNGPVDRSPAVWAADGTGFMLDPTDFDRPGEVLSISADGSTVAGVWAFDGFVWSAATGLVTIPRLDISLPSDPVYPNAIAAGQVYGGMGDAFFSIPFAFVWSPELGSRSLADVATAAGIVIPSNLVLGSVLGASTDGTVLVGSALDLDLGPRTFVLRLPGL